MKLHVYEVNATFHLLVIDRALDLLSLAAEDRSANRSGFLASEEHLALQEAREAVASLRALLLAPAPIAQTSNAAVAEITPL